MTTLNRNEPQKSAFTSLTIEEIEQARRTREAAAALLERIITLMLTVITTKLINSPDQLKYAMRIRTIYVPKCDSDGSWALMHHESPRDRPRDLIAWVIAWKKGDPASSPEGYLRAVALKMARYDTKKDKHRGDLLKGAAGVSSPPSPVEAPGRRKNAVKIQRSPLFGCPPPDQDSLVANDLERTLRTKLTETQNRILDGMIRGDSEEHIAHNLSLTRDEIQGEKLKIRMKTRRVFGVNVVRAAGRTFIRET